MGASSSLPSTSSAQQTLYQRELARVLAGERIVPQVLDSGDAWHHVSRLNARLLDADNQIAQSAPPTKIAILSLLFNWPSTGGGIVHTAELAQQLAQHGYEVRHFVAQYAEWQLGQISSPPPHQVEVLSFDKHCWTANDIQSRFQAAIAAFAPDYCVITDSWNTKALLAEAVSAFPYYLRLAAQECICPLNNVRLLPGTGGFRQCDGNQLTDPTRCQSCVSHWERCSGWLHAQERALAGFGAHAATTQLQQAFRQAAGVLVVNEQIAELVRPVNPRVHVIPSGFDSARFPETWQPPQSHARTRLLFAGLIEEPMKGFAVLAEAVERLSGERSDFEVWVTADPRDGVNGPYRFVGWQQQSELARVMVDCDVVVVPTIAQEALGRTAVEGMGAGRPVVASRIGGLPETVIDGQTGVLSTPGDPVDLAAKISALLDDAALRQRLGRAGRRRFDEHYTWDVMIEHYRGLFSVARSAR